MDEHERLRLARQGDLRAFNGLVLDCQDDAFTLACYLSGGDEARASALMETAVAQAYQGLPKLREGTFRAWLLCCVIRAGQAGRWKGGRSAAQAAGLTAALANLPADCRLAVLLVDLLGLDVPEAAQAARCSLDKLNHHLADARRSLVLAGG